VQLDGAVALVTGAGRGIGAALTHTLADKGCRVIAVGIDEEHLRQVAAATGAVAVVADVRDIAHADRIVRETLASHGRLDIVVANAGLGHAGAFADMSAERIDDLVSVNVRAPMLLARAALPGMLTQGSGSLVFVSSVAGALLVPREAVYSATKAAIEGFAEPLREELRGTGVTVTTVMPAVVATAFFEGRGEPYDRRYPRPLAPEHVAEAAVRAVQRGSARVVVPRWFALPLRIRGVAPTIYRRLARRFG
jgi:short-subunit dehydrogenase